MLQACLNKALPMPRRHLLPLTVSLLLAAPALAQQAPSTGQTVVVTATRHAMALIDAPAAIEVVTRAQIEARGADNLFDALRGDIGVSVQGRPISGRKVINLRGMDSRHTLVLVDGKRISASDGVIGHSNYQQDWIDSADIERIEVIRGPMSVLYGAEALGGVINVITRAPGQDRWRFGAGAEAMLGDDERGGDGWRSALHADGPLGAGLRLGVSARDGRRQAVTSSTDAAVSDLEGARKREATLRLHADLAAGHEVVAEHRAGDEVRWAGARERSGLRRSYVSTTPLERSHSALAWHARWAGAQDLRTLLRAYRSEIAATNSRSGGVAALRPNTLADRVLEGQVSLSPAGTQLSSGGFELRRETLLNGGLPGGKGEADHRALYLQHEMLLAAGLSLTAGLRHDQHSRFGKEWSPRAYLVWRPAPRWTIKGGYGHGFKAPTLKQVSADYIEDEGPYTYIGNAALQPETNDAVELVAGWDSGHAALQLGVFRNQVRQLVVTRPIGIVGGRMRYIFENTERATLQGLEASGRWLPLPAVPELALGASWMMLDATDGHGQRLEKRPRHQLALKLDTRAGRWRGGLRVEHQRGLLLASGVASDPLQAMPATTMLSAHAGLDIGHGLDLALGVDNLGNVDLARKSPLFAYAEAPRTWRLALRGRW